PPSGAGAGWSADGTSVLCATAGEHASAAANKAANHNRIGGDAFDTSEPVADEQERRPVGGMGKAAAIDQPALRRLERLSLGQPARLQLVVKIGHQISRGLVANVPQAGNGAARAGFEGDPGKAERGAVVAACRLAGAEHEQLKRTVAPLVEF